MGRGTKTVATTAFLSLVLVTFVMQSGSLCAQQSNSHQGADNAGVRKIVPKSGIWFGKFEGDKPFYLEVKNGALNGVAGISYVVSCGGFSESATDYNVDMSKIGGRSGHFKTLVPVAYTTPNSFVAVLSPGERDDNVKIKITLKGSFASANSASGTVTATTRIGELLCDPPTASSWTATPGTGKGK
jgi:hypothetical protein